jgi:hypothetical protein
MRKLAVALALLAALPLAARVKHKQKEFDPIVIRDARTIAGRYIGIEREFVIDIAVDANGRVSGTLQQFGVVTPLRNIAIDGAELRSSALHATYVDRVLNGDHAIGLLVRDITLRLEGMTLTSLFCRKQ